jgi:hypothetical protein
MRRSAAQPEQPQYPHLVTRPETVVVYGVEMRVAEGQSVLETLESAVAMLGVAADISSEIVAGLSNPEKIVHFAAAAEILTNLAAAAVAACVVPLMAVEKRVEVRGAPRG